MQGAGRGQDSMLVHMTPGEVQGLQSLALAHGGSLTINPKTGLPEAGFLSSLLPMIAGFALGPGGFGLMTSMQAGLAVGAVSTLATGSLSKGIMAGLGAYGGAGLGGGLNAVGSAAGAAAPTTSSLGSMTANSAPNAFTKLIPETTSSFTGTAFGAQPGGYSALTGGSTPFGQGYMPPGVMANAKPSLMFGNTSLKAVVPPPPPQVAVAQPQVRMAPQMPVAPPAQSVMFGGGSAPPADKLGYTPSDQLYAQKNPTLAGLKSATSNGMQGLKDVYNAMEKDSPYSSMAAGYTLLGALNEKPSPPTKKKSLIRPYTLDRQRVVDKDVGPSSSAERQYFNDVYTALTPYEAPGPEYAASGGMMGMAAGGYVDETMTQDAVSMDSGRPLPQQQPIYMGMQPQQPQQNIIAQPGNTMTTPGFANGGGIVALAGGGGMPSSSDIYRDGSGFDVSGAAEALSAELPQYKYLGNNQYELIEPVAKTGTTNVSNPVSTVEELNAIYQKHLGRDSDPTGQRIYMNRRGYTPEYVAQDIQKSEEYKPIGLRLAEEKKVEDARLAEEAKQATYANPTQIANVYDKVFGRTPDVGGLDYYSGQNLTPAEVEQQLRQSEEYKKKLTTPFVAPISYTGSTLSYDDVKKQLGHNPTLQEIATATRAFVPNRATIEGAPQYQTPEQRLGLAKTNALDSTPDFYAMMNKKLAEQGGYAGGGDINAYSLGGYSDGGRLLRGPGDGVSDSIPASIGDRQPARLADGEFVVPARIVSELGNGSTEAGAKRLYAMMDRVQKARTRTMGKGKVAVNSKADKYLPA
jgi:hypothetical protein